MFCIMKSSDLANGNSGSLQMINPTFNNKKRTGNAAKVACTNCRVAKLRCSAHITGCRRCVEKKLECVHPDTSGKRFGYRSSKEANRQGDQRQSHQMDVAQNHQMYQPGQQDAQTITELDDLINTTSTHGEASYLNNMQSLDPDFDGVFLGRPNDIPTDEDRTSTTTSTDEPSEKAIPWVHLFGEDQTFPEELFCEKPPTITNLTKESGPKFCCSNEALATFEAVEILRWTQRKIFCDVEYVFLQQKMVLSKCQQLLTCSKCTSQPSFVILVLSVCSKVLDTAEEVLSSFCSMEAGLTENNGLNSPAQSVSRIGTVENNTVPVNKSLWNRLGGKQRLLDQEDQDLILQSLLTARLNVLKTLVSKLKRIAHDQSWPVHEGLIQELQDRLAGERPFG